MAPENDDSADFDRLARRYLDLWQNQLAGLAADPGGPRSTPCSLE
jgi:hypothetical protein